MVAFVLPPRGQVAPADGPMSMFRRYSQGEEDEVIMMFLLLMLITMMSIFRRYSQDEEDEVWK